MGLGLGIGIGIGIGIPFSKGHSWSAIITDADRNKIAVTFTVGLNESSIPATTSFAIEGKVVTNIAIAGTVLTLTVDTIFDYSDSISFIYTKPVSNQLKSASGLIYGSFTQSVTNNITYPNFFADGNSKIWKDNTDSSTITKDVDNYVSRINHKLGGTIYFTATGTERPLLGANGDLIYDGIDDGLVSSASIGANLPITMYVVFRLITHSYPRPIVQWNPSYQTGFLVAGESGYVKVYNGITSSNWPILMSPEYNIAVMKIQGVNSTISINGATDQVFDSGNSAGGFTILNIFKNPSGSLNGAEKELIFRTGGDTSENRLKGYNYLKTKYGL